MNEETFINLIKDKTSSNPSREINYEKLLYYENEKFKIYDALLENIKSYVNDFYTGLYIHFECFNGYLQIIFDTESHKSVMQSVLEQNIAHRELIIPDYKNDLVISQDSIALMHNDLLFLFLNNAPESIEPEMFKSIVSANYSLWSTIQKESSKYQNAFQSFTLKTTTTGFYVKGGPAYLGIFYNYTNPQNCIKHFVDFYDANNQVVLLANNLVQNCEQYINNLQKKIINFDDKENQSYIRLKI